MPKLGHTHLRLLTFNLFGVPLMQSTRARILTLARELNTAPLDVLLFQEVQLARYVPLLRENLTRFPHVAFEPFLYAPKGGLVTFSRWPILKTDFALYEKRGHWHTPALADWMLHKGALITEVALEPVPVLVVNTHLVANYTADWSPQSRYVRHQHAELRQLERLFRGLDHRLLRVIAGDFNIPRGAWLYHEFMQATGAVDPLAESIDPTYRPIFPLPGRYSQALDHVFIHPPRGHALEASAKLVFRDKRQLVTGQWAYLSDHIAIQADIRVSREGGRAEAG